ncbi:hypothetical protein Rmf_19330 [Roseomonas fluvialis]|uniref:DUF397 domain-containing protein n=1 Tax=Roseomonas fluvialis TaxID=1750527 RepID=A0ABM7Y2I9_9PROT|nr:hypothetical protein Rmf_19330 [Roseomonas fluvialis]
MRFSYRSGANAPASDICATWARIGKGRRGSVEPGQPTAGAALPLRTKRRAAKGRGHGGIQ